MVAASPKPQAPLRNHSCTITGLWMRIEPNANLCGRMVGMSRMRAWMRSMVHPFWWFMEVLGLSGGSKTKSDSRRRVNPKNDFRPGLALRCEADFPHNLFPDAVIAP